MQKILDILYQGNHLDQKQTEELFHGIITHKLSSIQIAAALISMRIKGETLSEIIGAVNTLLTYVTPFPRPKILFADITGTGGDNKNTINISTASAIVASTCNVKVIKHGNQSISGLTGSIDLLHRNHINIKNNTINQALKNFNILGICFLHAMQYHPILQHIMPIRKELKIPTLFNIIGPLINPAKPPLILIGVYKKELLFPIIQILKLFKYHRAAVVHCDGIDEVGLHAITHVAELHNTSIYNYTLQASDFGLDPQPMEKLRCHSIKESSEHMINLLQGKGNPTHKFVVAANVALLLKLFGYEDLRANTALALNKMHQGIPYIQFKKLQHQEYI